MQHLTLTTQAVTHQTYALLLRLAKRANSTVDVHDDSEITRDRGAVSLEQVLWFMAAAIAVGGIATYMWGQIDSKANTPIVDPQAP